MPCCTRVHSSRMRTVRNRSRLLGEGCLLLGEVPARGGGVWSQGVPAPGGGCLLLWVSGPGGGIPACTEADPPLWTDRCKNITFATSLRTVINYLALQVRIFRRRYTGLCHHMPLV